MIPNEKTKTAARLRNRLCAGVSGVFRRDYVYVRFLAENPADFPCGIADCAGYIFAAAMKGAYIMKVVVLKSPKLFAGLLRVMFGIKKVHAEE